MKQIVFIISAIFLFSSCTPDDGATKQTSVLLLKLDYQTYKFEGGTEQRISSLLPATDTIPLKVDYKAPGDFGSIALHYKPGDELLFKGTIIWMGEGAISHPAAFLPANLFPGAPDVEPFPGNTQFQSINTTQGIIQADLSKLWNAVSDLRIVSEYRESGKKIGVMLYTPGVGVGDPAKWDWLVVMVK